MGRFVPLPLVPGAGGDTGIARQAGAQDAVIPGVRAVGRRDLYPAAQGRGVAGRRLCDRYNALSVDDEEERLAILKELFGTEDFGDFRVMERPMYIDNGRDITIGDGSIIGAGSVVTKDIPDWSFAAGNPCRVIRKITEEDRKYYFKDRELDEEVDAELRAKLEGIR